MYYGEKERLEKMSKLLEKFAYVSIASDFLIAISTYLVLQNAAYSSSFLLASDYLDLVEVVIATAIIVMIVTLKYYKRTYNDVQMFIARSRYRGDIKLH